METNSTSKATGPEQATSSILASVIIIAVLVTGGFGTLAVSNAIRDNAVSVWTKRAELKSEDLSLELSNWLNKYYEAPRSLSAIFESSKWVEPQEFLDSVQQLEDKDPIFFPDSLVFAIQSSLGDGRKIWEAYMTMDLAGDFEPNANISKIPHVKDTIEQALENPRTLILSSFQNGETENFKAVAAITTSNGSDKGIIVAALNLGRLFDGFQSLRVPQGLSFRIGDDDTTPLSAGRTSNLQSVGETLLTTPVRLQSGENDFTVYWDADSTLFGGAETQVANLVLISGGGATGFTALLLMFLLSQNRRVAERVVEATAELALKESQLRMALDNMPGAMIVVDKDLKLVLMNDKYTDFYGDSDGLAVPGGSLEDILRKEIELGFVTGDGSPEEILQQRLESFRSKETFTFQDKARGGRTIQMTRNSTPDGHTVSVASDITEIIEARRGEKLLKEALDTFSDMVILYDRDERVIFTNNRYHEIYPHAPPKEEIVNYTMEQLMRRSLESGLIDHPLAKSDPEAWLAQALSKRRNKSGSYGETTHATGRTYFFRNAWTTEGGMILVQFDITERKEQEDRLRKSEQQFRRILEDSPVAVTISIDDQSAEDGIMEFANPKFLQMIGIEESDIGKARTSMFMPYGERREDNEKALQRGESLMNIEQNVLGKGGEERWALMSISPIDYQEKKSALIWLYDITERKRAEEKLSDAYGVISGSIDYASRIQRSVLPDGTLFTSLFSDHFIMWEPRDVVGGDIYWARMWGDGVLIILGDCTGHGVPGAFMTLIATGALDNALSDIAGGQVGRLMQRLHQLVQVTLGQHGEGAEADDGMELGICFLGPDMDTLTFAGARFELYLVEDGNLSVIKGTRSGIGYYGIPHNQEYEENEVVNLKGKTFYMTTDGLVDQVGGERNRMFGKKRFRELLLDINDQPMDIQKERISQALTEYQGDQTRRDDVAVLGFKV